MKKILATLGALVVIAVIMSLIGVLLDHNFPGHKYDFGLGWGGGYLFCLIVDVINED